MPFTLEECIRLAHLGYDPPSPIEHYYRWPCEPMKLPEIPGLERGKPALHQIDTARFLTVNPRAFCLNDMGTMKTLTSLWAADFLMEQRQVMRVLVAAPLSTLERVWADHIFFHLRHRKGVVLHGSAKKRRKLLAEPYDFYIINHDGIGVIEHELAARADINLFIIDEIASYRNKQTAMWKALHRLIYPQGKPPKPWVWGLTGAPTPQEPTDAYGQCRLVTPPSVPKYFSHFRNMVMEHHSTYVWTPRPEATRIVYEAMRPAIRYKRDDCVQLPETIYQTRDVEFSAEQTKLYKDLMRDLYTEARGGRINAVNEGVLRSKLVQVGCGVVYDANGKPIEIDCGNRLDVLMELIEQVNEKVIVFVPFTAVTGMLARELNKHWRFEIVTGDTSVKERNQIFQDFQDPTKRIDLVAHPGCMSHGLTLTEASTIIWYAPFPSNETYQQANIRIVRPGQWHVTNIIHIAGSTAERKMYKRLETRQSLQGLLLEMVEKGE